MRTKGIVTKEEDLAEVGFAEKVDHARQEEAGLGATQQVPRYLRERLIGQYHELQRV